MADKNSEVFNFKIEEPKGKVKNPVKTKNLVMGSGTSEISFNVGLMGSGIPEPSFGTGLMDSSIPTQSFEPGTWDVKNFDLEAWENKEDDSDSDKAYKEFTHGFNKWFDDWAKASVENTENWAEWVEESREETKKNLEDWAADVDEWMNEGSDAAVWWKKTFTESTMKSLEASANAAVDKWYGFYDSITDEFRSFDKTMADAESKLFSDKMERASRDISGTVNINNRQRFYSKSEMAEGGWGKLWDNTKAAFTPWAKSKKQREAEEAIKKDQEDLKKADKGTQEAAEVAKKNRAETEEEQKNPKSETPSSNEEPTNQNNNNNSNKESGQQSSESSSSTESSVPEWGQAQSGDAEGLLFTHIMQSYDAQQQYFIMWFTTKDVNKKDVLLKVPVRMSEENVSKENYYFFYISDVSFKPFGVSTTALKYGPLQTSTRVMSKVKNNNEFTIKTSLDIGLSFYDYILQKCMGFNLDTGVAGDTVRGAGFLSSPVADNRYLVESETSKIDLHVVIPSKTIIDEAEENKKICVNHFILKNIKFSNLDKLGFGHSAGQMSSSIKGIYRKLIFIQNEVLDNIKIETRTDPDFSWTVARGSRNDVVTEG